MKKRIVGRLALAGVVALALSIAAPAIGFDNGNTGGSNGGDNGGNSGGGNPGGGSNTSAPSLDQARADIKAENWTAAIAALKDIVAASPSNADAYNLLGYSYRHAGDTKRAMTAYVRALKLNPKHAGALEYQGELFVQLGQLDKAKANLDKIKGICGTSCEEYEDLEKAIGA
jgi:tetratricopeptide (TPR) repeat protein